ncbi:Protein BRANCHLESS TRICHOME [Ananas comosus]|uniref:Protein BRANCHLESS TRICHOME n=1 Tax=Ananas comosus TaxID=4615 RepID=A0A199W5X8_ANACO|nr:Protein BRANCHLESS TRICHOME [Ananas comosus]
MEVEKMMGSSPVHPRNSSNGPNTTTFTLWKLYNNPNYALRLNDSPRHCPSPPLISSPSLRGITSNTSRAMDGAGAELEMAKAQIRELRAELEFERRMRRKVEALNKVLAAELAEERGAREAAEAHFRGLEAEVEGKRGEVENALAEIEEERRMLRVAEVWREERVQMKLAEAKLLMEETLRGRREEKPRGHTCEGCSIRPVMGPTGQSGQHSQNSQHQVGQQRRAEAVNPHIKRGIKGFVEFPKVIRVQAREGKVELQPNLECQRAQLRVLLRHKSSVGLSLLGASSNLVM